MKRILFRMFLFGLLNTLFMQSSLYGRIVYTHADSLVYEKYISEFNSYRNLAVNDLFVKTALYFINAPYVAATLEQTGEEALTVNLREFDCTTFVESCMALTITVKSGDLSFASYCENLKNIRYRKGMIEDYSSRLHYVSDWIHENEARDIITDVSKSLGGILKKKDINFMSEHPSLYRQLRENVKLRAKIEKVESELNKNDGLYVIAKETVCTTAKLMKNGDIVAFSTTVAGLDFTHIGIIYINNGQVTFIHASSAANKVIIERKTLTEYCVGSKKCDGIVLLRLNEDLYEKNIY